MAPRRARSRLPGGITSPCPSARLERAPLTPSSAGAGAPAEDGAAGTQVAPPFPANSVHQVPVLSGYRDIATPYSFRLLAQGGGPQAPPSGSRQTSPPTCNSVRYSGSFAEWRGGAGSGSRRRAG